MNVDRACSLLSLVQINNIIFLYEKLSARLYVTQKIMKKGPVLFEESHLTQGDIVSVYIAPTCKEELLHTKQLVLEKRCLFTEKSLSLLIVISSIFTD